MTLPQLRPWVQSREAVRQLLHGATLRTCAPVALVVGTLLSIVDRAGVVLSGSVDGRVPAKFAANLLIPALTSGTGALLAVRVPRQSTVARERSS